MQLSPVGVLSTTCLSHLRWQHRHPPSPTPLMTKSGLVNHFRSYLPETSSPPPYQLMSELLQHIPGWAHQDLIPYPM